MNTLLTDAKQHILAPAGITDTQIQQLVDRLQRSSIDDADLYFQSMQSESWELDDNKVKQGCYQQAQGVGIRTIQQQQTGFAYANDLSWPTLQKVCQAAGRLTQTAPGALISVNKQPVIQPCYTTDNPIPSCTDKEKVDLLHTINNHAHSLDSRVKRVSATLQSCFEVILIITREGAMFADMRPLVRLNVQVIAEAQGRREIAYSGGGARSDYLYFWDKQRYLGYVEEAVRQACIALSAKDAPAGVMPVVLGNGWPGVLLHEAIGHGLEGDFNRKGTSVFTHKMGQKVANSAITVVDQGNIPQRRGSLTIDDEGTVTQQTVLIDKGILCNYLQDKLNARLMGMQPTGNGRRESYAHLPMPRMTNTYMLAGQYSPEEIIASVKRGIYAVNFAGGQVDITSGKFVFDASEAYLIENGKVTQPIKGATLIGSGAEVLQKVSMVGNDLAFDSGVGTCGKDGQSVPVGVGQPTLRVDQLTVGGVI